MAPADGRLTFPFTKYQGAGNDFVVVDARMGGALAQLAGDAAWAALARQVCDRHFGAGADGLLVAAKPVTAGATQCMRMYNPDGSESEMCGNGLRCFVRWLADEGDLAPGEVAVQTGAGVLRAALAADGMVTVDMGAPRLAPADIPLSAAAAMDQPPAGPVMHLPLKVAAAATAGAPSELDVTCVSMGNPHAVHFVEDVESVPLDVLGPVVERHAAFPRRTNVEVCQVVAPDRLRVRVWERGAGLTLACGTGACASLAAARLRGLAGERATLELPGGTLSVQWPGGMASVRLSGPAVRVYRGIWNG